MGMFCQPNKTPDGRNTTWGTVDPEDLFGPQGWCMAAEPKIQCDCYLDGGRRLGRGWLPACRCLHGLLACGGLLERHCHLCQAVLGSEGSVPCWHCCLMCRLGRPEL